MVVTRRLALQGALALAAGALAPPLRAATRARVAIVGGGWGGLACARALRQIAPGLDVTLIERDASFFSLPLSNRVLAGTLDAARLQFDARAAAARHGYARIEAEVTAIDRDKRRLRWPGGEAAYDWLVLAPGIRYDWSAWFGSDTDAAARCAREFPCGMRAGEFADMRRVVDAFHGGDLLMNVPAQPGRCPPAPYERAVAIAARIRRERLKARLILVDPGPGALGFRQLFAERYRDEIVHLTNATITHVDPVARRVRTEFDDIRFDAALLAPPQQAADPVWQAGLVGAEAGGEAGRSRGWAAVQPLSLRAIDDERIFVIGDAVGAVSPLFGHYPKSAHVAVRMARIVAGEIAARAAGRDAPAALPDSVCYVGSDVAPPESLRIDARFHQRGDGVIVQTVRQHRDPQPRGEDEVWLASLVAELF